MIYEMLLIQEGGMFIPSDIFARRNYRRTGSIPHECSFCELTFLSRNGCVQHEENHHGCAYLDHHQPLRPLLPAVSLSLLQTCRIIRLEASPILYSRNSFHFSDPATASNFRWGTDCAQAGAIQEIGIKFGSHYHKKITPWMTYITERTLSLSQDFPHLRRMTFNLRALLGAESNTLLRSMFERFRERSRGLDWVLVLKLRHDLKLLDCFEPLVDKENDSKNVKKEVRRHVWADGTGGFWKNALLWWGFPGEAVPSEYKVIAKRTSNGEGSTQPTSPAP